MADETQANGFYKGWVVVGAAFMVMFVGFACAYSFTSYFPQLQDEFSASRAEVALIFSLAGSLYFALGALSGPLADRVGPRWICVAGMLALGGGLALASRANSVLMVYVGFGLGIGVGVGFSYVPAIGAVQPWFTRRRGTASGIAVSGIGLGTLLGPTVAAWLILSLGWRESLLWMGIVAMAIGIFAAFFLDNDPGGRRRQGGHTADSAAGLIVSEAIRTKPFWLLYCSALLLSVGLFVPFVHIVPFTLDQGYGAQAGAYVLGTIGLGSTLGRFAVGGLADRFGRVNVMVVGYFGVSAMLFFWLASSGLWSLYLFGLIFGTCYGGFVALAPAVATDFFGTRSASSVIGVLYTSVAVGTFFGPTFAGYVYDQSQSYVGAILMAEFMTGLAVILVCLLPNPVRWSREQGWNRPKG